MENKKAIRWANKTLKENEQFFKYVENQYKDWLIFGQEFSVVFSKSLFSKEDIMVPIYSPNKLVNRLFKNLKRKPIYYGTK